MVKYLGNIVLALLFLLGSAQAQSSPKHYLSAVSTNSTNVLPTRGFIKALLPANTTSTIYYLKLYDKATAPTCGTDTPVWTVPVPPATDGLVVPIAIPDGLQFDNGIGFCLTGAIADNDTTSAAVGVAINFGVSGR